MNESPWRSLIEYSDPERYAESAADEFAAGLPASPDRRDFLKLAGFSVAALFSGCSRIPVEKAIPYAVQPEDAVAGRAEYFASVCDACTAGCGVLVKVRDGRPIKLEGNPAHPVSRGALCAVGQASILELYDSLRLTGPSIRGQSTSWNEADTRIATELERARQQSGKVRFLSGSIVSPTKRSAVERFLSQFNDGALVEYSALSRAAILEAHERTHGLRALPRYRFDRASVIVSFDCDFLGTWISPVEHTRGWSDGRSLEGSPPRQSHHIQLESRLSLTGSKANERLGVSPGESIAAIQSLAGSLLEGRVAADPIERIARRLRDSRGQSLVVSGSSSVAIQVLVNRINQMLGNYETTLDLDRPSLQARESDQALLKFVDELRAGRIHVLLIDGGVNPVYELPFGSELGGLFAKVPLSVSLSPIADETAQACELVCPDSHPLESWSDSEPVRGVLSIRQPAIRPIRQTRSVLESLSRWSGAPQSDYELVREHWKAHVFNPRLSPDFDAFWNETLHDGVADFPVAPMPRKPVSAEAGDTSIAAALDADWLLLYPKVSIGDGRHAGNPFLQEMPDPVSRVTWDNYVSISPARASTLQVSDGDVLRVEADGASIELPCLVQPGLHDRTVAIALGYGGIVTRRFARTGPGWLHARTSVGEDGLVGKNAAPFVLTAPGELHYERPGVRVTRTGRRRSLAGTQDHHVLTVPELPGADQTPRPIIQEAALDDLVPGTEQKESSEEHELWPADHPYRGHRWGMTVDLNRCTGCAACVIACQVENNVPVVGRDEVERRRIMHWLRIDRYYSGPPSSPAVTFQPMMCQHCGHAPCEGVCPVLATVHGSEGLNQQVYNRCVGTRYCANNCPYKTRRFNWFDYPHDDQMATLLLNPDVTVRSRGVMEKCSFCVQRIHEAKAEAGREDRDPRDDEIQTACQQACPAGAIVFGDMNDPGSRVSKRKSDRRAYRVLEEINVEPSVTYLKVVR